ncbi:MAG TPA: DNA polymerase III subunit delta' [Stellaceae bacterium]|nr:DNA polymerase III subunit delta' [Stellaceae bacterium]
MASPQTTDDEAPDPFAPRRNPTLIGHGATEAALLAASESGRLPHAIILGGPRGIGKATLAFRFTRFLLAGDSAGDGLFAAAPKTDLAIDPEHPTARRVAAAGHADLLTVERGLDPRRKRMRSEIVVDDVREIASFLRLTSAEGGWRIVVIDSADEMNRNATNALLKVLEEPPRQALLLLVCHAPGRLLPTIRSRCRLLRLEPLGETAVVELLRQHRPALPLGEATALARLSEGSIGRAIDLADAGGVDLYRSLLGLLGELPQLDVAALHRLAERVAASDDSWRTFVELLTGWLAQLVTRAAGDGISDAPEIVPGEATLGARLATRRRLDQWVEVWEGLRMLFSRADAVNLDRKQVVLDAFLSLETAAR